MKILLTGGTKVQVDTVKGHRRVMIGMIPSLIDRQLQELGEVDRRPVKVGESLDGYDVIWVCISPMTSLKCQYGLGMTWTMAEAWEKKIPLVVYFDDWQTALAFNAYRSFARYPEKTIMKVVGGSYLYLDDLAVADQHKAKLIGLASAFESRDPAFWERVQVAYPKFRHWGDGTIMDRHLQLPAGSAMGYDPSILMKDDVETADLGFDEHRKRRWMFATLVPHDKRVARLKLGWPVDWYGPKKFKSPVLRTEKEVLEMNNQYWGSLSIAYPMDGAGWWRRRYAFSAYARSVLLTSSKEAQEQLGPAYQVPASQIEQMDDSDLLDLADRQQDRFLDGFDMSYDAAMKELVSILHAADARAGERVLA